MNKVIREHIFPKVGHVKWPGFDRDSFGHITQLQLKILKHSRARNAHKLAQYLALCIQEWPVFDNCPINRRVIDEALQIIGEH